MGAGEIFAQLGAAALLALGTWAAARWAYRGSKEAARETAAVTAQSVAASREDAFVRNVLSRLEQVEAEATTLRQSQAQAFIRDTQREREIQLLREEVEELREEREQNLTLIEQLKAYIKTLREQIRRLGRRPPAPPKGVAIQED